VILITIINESGCEVGSLHVENEEVIGSTLSDLLFVAGDTIKISEYESEE